MTLEEFNEYAEAHDYVIFTRQQYEHVIDVFNNYELLLFDYGTRRKVDMEAMLNKIRAEIAELWHYYPMGHDYEIAITRCLAVIDKYKAGDIVDILQIIDKYKAESEGNNGNV